MPHGRQFGYGHDDHPNGSPDGLQIEKLMKELNDKKIGVQVVKTNDYIDKCLQVMNQFHSDVQVLDLS